MPTKKKANAYSQPHKGLPTITRRRPERDGGALKGPDVTRPSRSSPAAKASLAVVPRQPHPPHASFSPQVIQRTPQVVTKGSQSQALHLRGERLPRLPCPDISQDNTSRRTRTGRQGKMGPKIFPTVAPDDRQVRGPSRRRGQRVQSGKIPLQPPLLTKTPVLSLPRTRTGVTQEKTVPLPSIQVAAPRHTQAARATCKLPPLPPAASAAAAKRRTVTVPTASSSHLPPVPTAQGTRAERGTATSGQSLRAAPSHPKAQDGAVKPRSRVPVPDISRKSHPGSKTPSQKLAAQQDQALNMPVSASLGKDAGTRHQRHMSDQGPALPRVHMKRTLTSTSEPVHDKSRKDLTVIPKTEPSQDMKTMIVVGHSITLKPAVKSSRRLPRPDISPKRHPGRQRPSQQPAAQKNRALPMPASASQGREAGTQLQSKRSEQDPALPRVSMKRTLPSTPLPGQHKTGKDQTIVPMTEPPQQQQIRRQAPAECRVLPLRKASLQLLGEISHNERVLKWLETTFPKNRGALAEEEKQQKDDGHQKLSQGEDGQDKELSQREDSKAKEVSQGEDESEEDLSTEEDSSGQELSKWEESSDEELSQGEDSSGEEMSQEEDVKKEELSQGEDDVSQNIWDDPLGLVNEQDSHNSPQEVPSSPSNMGTEAAGEAAGDLPSPSPATASPMDSKPAHGELARAPEEKQHPAPLAPEAQPAALAAASPAFAEQVAAAGTESQAAAPHSPCCPPSPLPSLLQDHALSEHWVGTLGGPVYTVQDLSQGEGDREPSTPQERLPVPVPQQALVFGQHSQVPGHALPGQMEARAPSQQPPGPQRQPSRFRRALRALRRLFRWPRRAAPPQDQSPTASARPGLH